MNSRTYTNSQIINGIALGFSISFFIASFIAAHYTGEWGQVFYNWYLIMISPCPLVTDYFDIGGLSSAFLNAGACGFACSLFMILLKGESRANTLAGFFLIVAHCFYGLNFFNMWPCLLSPFIYLRYKKLDFKKNFHVCMFTTSFSPFISEFLFRYTQGNSFVFGQPNLTIFGVILAILCSIMLGYVVPAILPGAQAWHKGYNLYNGGLAFGLFGFFLYNFMYRTMGLVSHGNIVRENLTYSKFNHSYRLFANIYFLTVFFLCILVGYLLNNKSFHGLGHLVKDTGYSSDFAEKYGMPLCLINIGLHGSLFLLYLNLSMSYTFGAGFTGPTVGVVLAALTFSAMGQHPKNVWPIILGYQTLYFLVMAVCKVGGWNMPWTLSTQGYINGVAFATGLCPIVGRYGIFAGVAAGFMCASMCTSTGYLHGGFVLYNGGFTAGITALILLPILEHYVPKTREEISPFTMNMSDMISLIGNIPFSSKEKKEKK